MPTLVEIQTLFVNFYQNLITFWNTINGNPITTHLDNLADKLDNLGIVGLFGQLVLQGIARISEVLFGQDATILNVLLLGAVTYYVVYVLFSWLVDIAP